MPSQIIDINGTPLTLSWPSNAPAPIPTPTPTPLPTPTPPASTVPTFSYLGSFYAPVGTQISNGLLAGRTLNGQLRFFDQQGNCGNLIEFALPSTLGQTLTTSPTATIAKNWGNVTAGRLINAQGQPLPNLLGTQLWWDPQYNGVWWCYFNNYNVTGAIDPSIGFTALDDATGTCKSYGPWMFNSTSHTTNRWINKIGATFYIGSIGTDSGNAASSWGPALSSLPAFDPRTTPPNTTPFPITRLINYPISNKAPRPADWVPHGSPDTDVNKWSQIDGYAGTGTLIDGWFAFLGQQGTGHIWYSTYQDPLHPGIVDVANEQTTGPHMSAPARLMLYLYKQPSQTWDAAIDLSAVGGPYLAYKRINGCYYDAANKHLYVSVKGIGPQYDYRPIIHKIQVS